MEKNILAGLEPQKVFEFFEELSRIPHGSGNTEAASKWAAAFAEKRGLRHRRDAVGNVVIWKDASPGYEDHPAVMLQGHLDMVCVKDNGVEHDFLKDPLDLYVDGDWVKARGTTLGGDDGIAIAMAMAVLDDGTIPHPPLEAVFTVGEEVGMDGANALDVSGLKSRCLINIDSEAEGILTVGCAGGARADIAKTMQTAPGNGNACTITINELKGGHSGVDIGKGRVNANRLLADYLSTLPGLRIVSLHGGEQDNAIPNRAEAVVLLTGSQLEEAEEKISDWVKQWKANFPQDADWYLVMKCSGGKEALSAEDSQTVLQLIRETPNGIQSMEPDLPGQVRTSLNLGVLRLEKGELRFSFCVRSSSGAEKERLFQEIRAAAEKYGASYSQHGEYPAWEYRKDSRLRETMIRIFEKQYGKKPVVETIHAGLECGLLADKLPGLDAVSIGPDMVDIHSPRERMSVASVQRTWAFLLEVLAAL
ncbi:MAG: aminoacyl-histidine dipeptidase [Oscillospiraceae bacterium]|nr:aminoacyl-histidine dipeptidase [Oscillospiraceae bacterium]